MSIPDGTKLSRYRVLDRIGHGGMGEVYLAKDEQLGRQVALKVLLERLVDDRAALARFQREARLVAALSHPNILTVHDIGKWGKTTYIVTEFLQGETLAERLKRGPISVDESLGITVQVASGLEDAHVSGVIHRDIKPSNIFLTSSGVVKILDFGLARLEETEPRPDVAQDETVSLETTPGTLIGTVSYMSPEQVRGQTADARSDIFSLGCVVYEMITGKRPFDGGTQADVIAAILTKNVQSLTKSVEIPFALDELVLRCLRKEPEQRFPSAAEFLAELESARKTVSTGDDSGWPPQPESSSVVAPDAAEKPITSVAVLAFANIGNDPDNAYFSDGLTEELINALSHLEGLRVASRTSSFAFKDRNLDVRQIGQQLNVQSVLEGSVRKRGDRIRLSVSLISIDDGYQLWSQSYDRRLDDIFVVQDEIAESVTRALRLILSESEKGALHQQDTASFEAYDFYLRGLEYMRASPKKNLEFAREMFSRAVEVDDQYGRAYAGIAYCDAFYFMAWDRRSSALHRSDESSRKALELDPTLADAHVARGLYLSLVDQLPLAERHFETAIRLQPSLWEAFYYQGRACLRQGKLQQASELFEKAVQVRPDEFFALLMLATTYSGLGQHEQSKIVCRQGVENAEKHLQFHPHDAYAWAYASTGWALIGDKTRGIEWADKALTLAPEEPMTLYNIACTFALAGQTDRAIDCLEMTIDRGYLDREWIENDADLRSLHPNPRFESLLQRLA